VCLLAVAWKARPDVPLAVSANRDEMYARASAGPRIENVGSLPVLMPLDLVAGGTWLGVNASGLFVGVTNRAGAARDPARRSRGLLVRDAMAASSARALHALLAALEPLRYNGFHLLYADRDAAFVTWSDGEKVTHRELEPGLHVLSERSFGAGTARRETLVRERIEKLLGAGPPTASALRETMRFHADDTLEAACVHADAVGYGTRSSFQLVLPAADAPSALWTDGPPCTAHAEDITPLAARLLGPARAR